MTTTISLMQALSVVGAPVRDGRRRIGWSQRELGSRAQVAQSRISRIERGHDGAASLATIDRLFVALGIRYILQIDLPHSNRQPRDVVHARCVAYVCRRLRAAGWLVEREVE